MQPTHVLEVESIAGWRSGYKNPLKTNVYIEVKQASIRLHVLVAHVGKTGCNLEEKGLHYTVRRFARLNLEDPVSFGQVLESGCDKSVFSALILYSQLNF